MSDANVVAKIEPAAAPAVHGESAALISMIERAARDPAVDIAKMERLFDMHERIESRRAEQAFNSAMAAAQAELQPVARRLENSHTRSKYADINAIYEMAKPIITKHGFAPSYGTAKPDTAGHVKLVCDLMHAGGFSKRYEQEFPLDGAGVKGNSNKTDIQATGSTMTYGRRYMTLGIFDIATKDDKDGNATTPAGFISEAQYKELADLIRQTNTDLQAFLDLGGVESLADIPAAQFQAAKAKLVQKQRQGARRP
jgi:hypothetical protein